MVLKTTDIRLAADCEEFMTQERCHISEVANDSLDEGLSVAIARVEPGVCTAWHSLKDTSERYLIISGKGRVELDAMFGDYQQGTDNKIINDVSAGDVVRIAPDVAQRIINTADEDLIFYAVCTPRFKQENYVSLE